MRIPKIRPAASCDRLYLLTDERRAGEPGVFVDAAGDVPAHCRVRGVIDGAAAETRLL